MFLEKNRKKVRLGFFLCAILAGALLGRVLSASDTSAGAAIGLTILAMCGVVFAACVVNWLWYRAFLKEVDKPCANFKRTKWP